MDHACRARMDLCTAPDGRRLDLAGKLGWLWTSQGTYPYLFENLGQNWLFHHGSNGVESLFSPLRSPIGYEFPSNKQ